MFTWKVLPVLHLATRKLFLVPQTFSVAKGLIVVEVGEH